MQKYTNQGELHDAIVIGINKCWLLLPKGMSTMIMSHVRRNISSLLRREGVYNI